MDDKKFANIPVKLVGTTKDGKKVKIAVAVGGSFYNCILTPEKAYKLAMTLQEVSVDVQDNNKN